MKLLSQLRLSVIVLVGCAAFNVGLVYMEIDRMTNDGRVVNFAGIVRGLSQRLVKLEISGQAQEEIILKLDRIVNGLLNGDRALQLPKPSHDKFIYKMKSVETKWSELKETIRETRKNNTGPKNILKASEEYWEITNVAVFAAEDFSKENVNLLKTTQLILFGLNAIVLAIIGWAIAGNIASTLQKAIHTIAASSTEISVTVEEHERVATQQAISAYQTTATMDELGVSSQLATAQALSSVTGAQLALNLASDGLAAVEKTLEEMAILKEKVGAIAQQIMQLSHYTDRIGSIANLVSKVAIQTNLLALNAAVEARRAGGQNQIFGVVAAEIRRLADESKQSAHNINALVADIQVALHSTVTVTAEGTKTVEDGVKIVRETAAAFSGVTEAIDNIVLYSQQISLNAQQQALAIQQAIEAINLLSVAAKESADGITQTKIGIKRLSETALDLKAMV